MATQIKKAEQDIKQKPSNVIKPLVRINDAKHVLETAYDELTFPEMKAVGIMKTPNGSSWLSYVITIAGDKVVSIEIAEPQQHMYSIMEAKASFEQDIIAQGSL